MVGFRGFGEIEGYGGESCDWELESNTGRVPDGIGLPVESKGSGLGSTGGPNFHCANVSPKNGRRTNISFRILSASLIMALSQVLIVVPLTGASPPVMESGPKVMMAFHRLTASGVFPTIMKLVFRANLTRSRSFLLISFKSRSINFFSAIWHPSICSSMTKFIGSTRAFFAPMIEQSLVTLST